MSNADIRNHRSGGTRRKVALALVGVAITSLVMASEASAKPGRKNDGPKKAKSVKEQVVETGTETGTETGAETGIEGSAIPAVGGTLTVSSSGGSGEDPWGQAEGVRWK